MGNKEKNLNVESNGNLIKLGRSIFIVDITHKDCLETIDDISEDQFPNLILLIKKNSHRYKHIDIGSYCFESRTRRNTTEVETKVDIKSIDTGNTCGYDNNVGKERAGGAYRWKKSYPGNGSSKKSTG